MSGSRNQPKGGAPKGGGNRGSGPPVPKGASRAEARAERQRAAEASVGAEAPKASPDEMPRLLAPLEAGSADLVLGSRARGSIEPGSMPPPQRFGNWLVARLMSCVCLMKFPFVTCRFSSRLRSTTWVKRN